MSNKKNIEFSGSWVALITPMNNDGEIEFDDLRKLVDWHIESGTNGLVILGTTAETATLSEDEQIAILEVVIDQNNGRLPIVVGNGSNCTRSTIEKTKRLDSLAIDGYLTVTPYYNKPTQKGMLAHFKAIAAQTDKPIILYNVPGRTGVDLDNEIVVELMAVENIIGIKDATADMSRVKVMKKEDPHFLLFSGDDFTSLEYLKLGGNGVISVTANVEPQIMAQMVSKSIQGDFSQAEKLDQKVSMLHDALFVESNPVPTKWALQNKGLLKSDMVRLPLITMEPINHNVIKQALQHAK